MRTADIVIAGGGIIGLASALELALDGMRVIVIERGHAMSEASWAAAGMLAAHDPENPSLLGPLSELSLSLYPAFLGRVQGLSGHSIPLRTRETLQGSRAGQSFTREAAGQGHLIDDATAAEAVAGLNSRGRQFLLLNEDSLDPRDLCVALPRSVVACGAGLEQETSVLAVKRSGESVVVETTHGEIAAGAFLNCCGAWAGSLPGTAVEPAANRLSIEPRKGHLVALQMPAWANIAGKSLEHSLKKVLRTPEIYLVPRGDGRIVAGSTVEHAGFNKTVDEDRIDRLVNEACDLWPPLRSAKIVDTWAGLRPGSADGLPLIGSCGDHQWIASGHFRNGILLAPATARILRQMLSGERAEVAVDIFAPDRFALHEG